MFIRGQPIALGRVTATGLADLLRPGVGSRPGCDRPGREAGVDEPYPWSSDKERESVRSLSPAKGRIYSVVSARQYCIDAATAAEWGD